MVRLGRNLSLWFLALLFAAPLGACKARRADGGSEVKATTQIDYRYVDLTTYKNGDDVTDDEIAAAKQYTSDDKSSQPGRLDGETIYSHVNRALRKFLRADINAFDDTIKNLSSLVNKSRSGSCTFYRYFNANVVSEGVTLNDALGQRGKTYIERGFLSTTTSNIAPKGFEAKTDIIVGRSAACAPISSYSAIKTENEVLFPPGSEFIVTQDVFRDSYNRRIYSLDEIPPGTTKSPESQIGTVGEAPKASEGGGSNGTFDISTMIGTYTSARGSVFMVRKSDYQFRFFSNANFYTLTNVTVEDQGESVKFFVQGTAVWFKFHAISDSVMRGSWSNGGESDYTKTN